VGIASDTVTRLQSQKIRFHFIVGESFRISFNFPRPIPHPGSPRITPSILVVNPAPSSGALAAPAVLAHRRGRQALAQRVKPRRKIILSHSSRTFNKVRDSSPQSRPWRDGVFWKALDKKASRRF